MDQSRIKLVGAIVVALSMPSIWQTRSSFATAQVDKKANAPVEKATREMVPAGKANASTEEVPTEDSVKIPAENVPTENIPTGNAPTENIPTGKVPTGNVPTETAPQESAPTNTVPSEKEPSNAPNATPTLDKTRTPLSAIIEKKEIELKPGRALTDSEQRQLLIGEALARHGSPGLFIVSFMKGSWTIDRPLLGSSAERAGLKPGDVIVSIDGKIISGEMPVRDVYFTMCGSRGQYRSFVVERGAHQYRFVVPLWGINDMRDRRTQYIEYYWYLMYHNMMSAKQYFKAVKPFNYLKMPVRYSKVPVHTKKPYASRSGRSKGKSR